MQDNETKNLRGEDLLKQLRVTLIIPTKLLFNILTLVQYNSTEYVPIYSAQFHLVNVFFIPNNNSALYIEYILLHSISLYRVNDIKYYQIK